jgi:prepilin-type N-terminal cleavage/methylation domain-containing protein
MASTRTSPAFGRREQGFTLVETLVALFILVFGLMAAGQMMALAARGMSLARSQGSAMVLAESKLVYLIDLHRRDPYAAELATGDHGPEEFQVWNRTANRVLNRFRISWTISRLSDPRPGKETDARQVAIRVMPVDEAGKRRFMASMNKEVVLAAVLSARFL